MSDEGAGQQRPQLGQAVAVGAAACSKLVRNDECFSQITHVESRVDHLDLELQRALLHRHKRTCPLE